MVNKAHLIIVKTNQTIKDILSRVDTFGRMTKWGIELVEFGIEYASRIAIKAQNLEFDKSPNPTNNF
ncbi:Integrase, catalytic core [Gossypium australe]|uniref:Integrase, catalytic core n=1 Tax=Gossypium australe TaxID=47621 RepID=A0A5B6WHW2_9ROSI|nr:Integrase, catalytic core [Gossypium australe]